MCIRDRVLREAKALREQGKAVLVQRQLPGKLTYRTLVKLIDGEVTVLEAND